eukprot:3693738-Pleurochrysis_carterae.AAC.3
MRAYLCTKIRARPGDHNRTFMTARIGARTQREDGHRLASCAPAQVDEISHKCARACTGRFHRWKLCN